MNSDAHPRRYRGALAAVVLVTGCAVGPDFQKPAAPTQDRYDQTPSQLPSAGEGHVKQALNAATAPAAQWWRTFSSTELDDTVAAALEGSPTLDAARATLAAANETLAAARGERWPQADAAASASHGNGGVDRKGGRSKRDLYSVGGAVSYAVDPFGGIRRRVEQQAAFADVARAELAAAYLSLTGDVVIAAIDRASAAELLAAAQEIIALDQHNLELVQISEAAGKSAGTDVLTAEGQLANDRAQLPPLRQQLDVARHALAVLTGRAPADWRPPEFTFATMQVPTELPLTLPSELVGARPDIVAAEAQLHAATAAVGVATAQLYPSLTLSGSWTSAAEHTSDLFKSNADIWSVAAGLAAPLFHGGTLRAERRAAIDELAAALAQYREVVLNAFGQVADALNALEHDAEALDAQHAALETARATLELTQQSYEAGQASFIQVLIAQRLYQEARVGVTRAESARYLDTALYFLALGGDAIR